MPRPKTQADAQVLAVAHRLIHARGPDALTFAALARATGLSASTLVQRFVSKAGLMRATLHHAWDRLDERTAQHAATTPRTPKGAIALLVELSRAYGDIESYAEGLLVLREDLRDPELRARGAAWKTALSDILDRCLDARPEGVGLMMAAQWQGALLWWSFEPQGIVEDFVEEQLHRFIAAVRR
jgi:AcrR family transcriptional regulator